MNRWSFWVDGLALVSDPNKLNLFKNACIERRIENFGSGKIFNFEHYQLFNLRTVDVLTLSFLRSFLVYDFPQILNVSYHQLEVKSEFIEIQYAGKILSYSILCSMFWAGCIYGGRNDAERFGFFCHAALEFLLQRGSHPVSYICFSPPFWLCLFVLNLLYELIWWSTWATFVTFIWRSSINCVTIVIG